MAISLQSMMQDTLYIEQSIKERYDLKGAERKTQELIKKGHVFIQAFYGGNHGGVNPFPVACKLVEIVSLPAIEFCDEALLVSSTALRIFLELSASICASENRKVYPSNKQKMVDTLAEIVKSLPSDKIEIRHELKCAHQAAKMLKADRRYLFKSLPVIESISKKSFSPALKFADEFIRYEKVKKWFRLSHEIRWGAHKMISVDDLGKFKDEFAQYQSHGNGLAICIGELFMNILSNPNASVDLKRAVFSGGTSKHEPNLLKLADLGRTWTKRDKYWKTRFRGVQFLAEISANPGEYFPKAMSAEVTQVTIQAIVLRMVQPRERKMIKDLGIALYKKAPQPDLWDSILLGADASGLDLDGSKDPELSSLITLVDKATKSVEEDEKQLDELLEKVEKLKLSPQKEKSTEQVGHAEDPDSAAEHAEWLSRKVEATKAELSRESTQRTELEKAYKANRDVLELIKGAKQRLRVSENA